MPSGPDDGLTERILGKSNLGFICAISGLLNLMTLPVEQGTFMYQEYY